MENRIAPKIFVAISAAVGLVLGLQRLGHGQSAGESRIYWTVARDLGWIQRADLDGSNIESVLTTKLEVNPNRIAMDPVLGKIYWTEVDVEDDGGGSIRRANLDGSDVETLITGLQDPFDLAVDPFEQRMYWTNLRGGTIQRAGLDGDNVETLITGLEAPADIALGVYLDFIGDSFTTSAPNIQPVPHLTDRRSAAKSPSLSPTPAPLPTHIYWTDRRTGTIQRADLDGNHLETLVTGLGSPAGLFVFMYDSIMTWGDRDAGVIQWAYLDGSHVETVITGVTEVENVIVPYVGLILWVEWDSDSERGAVRGSFLQGRDDSGSYIRESYTISETAYGPGDLETALDGRLYWTDTNRIYRLDDFRLHQETYQSEPISMGTQGPTGIALDLQEDRMYWVDKWTNTIRRSGLDGSQVEDLVAEVESPEDIALDLAAEKMYWAEGGTGAIRRADLDGSNGEILVETEGSMGIALDVFRGRMYWTARGDSRFSDGGVIQRSNLDGSQVETLVAGLGDLEDIALDLAAGKMYLTEARVSLERWAPDGRILRFDLDGSNSEVLITGLVRPVEIALDVVEGKLYWTDRQDGRIHRADLDGGNVEEVVTGLVRPVGLALDAPLPDAAPDSKPTSRIEVVATVLGDNAGNMTVQFARSITGHPPHFAWSAVTDEAGRLALTIPNPAEDDSSGLYQARALTATGKVVSRWEGISLDHGWRYGLELVLGGGVRIVASQRLGVPNTDPCSNGIVVPDPLINRGLVEDCQALLEFRDNLGFANFVGDRSWSASKPITSWLRIRDSRVRELRLALDPVSNTGPSVKGTISPSLGRLTELEELSFHQVGLYGPIPPELGNLKRLKHLDLSYNRLTGPIPPELGNLTNLIWLDLSGNDLSGSIPPELGNLKNLKRLYIDINDLTGPIPPELGNLTNLIRLNLNDNQLTGPIPPELGNLTNLADVTATSPKFPGLDLSNNQLTGPIPPELGKLTQVKKFLLHHNRLTGPIPAELAHIEELDLSFNRMQGPIPQGLEHLTNLSRLTLSYNQLTGPIRPELGQLTQLRFLSFEDNQLTGPIPPELGNLKNLIWLHLNLNELTGPIPPELGQLTQLSSLNLYDNQLTGPIPPELGNLTNLTKLNLHFNELTGPIPPELGQLTHLRSLSLRNNQLTGPIPPELGNLQLTGLYLVGNEFTCVPEALSKWADYLPVCQPVDLDPEEADFDGDGAVGFGDFFLFADAFGGSDSRFDLDGSGSVDFGDFFLLADYFADPARGKLLALAREMIGLPDGPQLRNAPNPFNGQTVISWFILTTGMVRLEIYNTLGQRVRTLVDEVQAPGRHQVSWDARDQRGAPVAAGVYLSRLQYPGGVRTQRLLFLK